MKKKILLMSGDGIGPEVNAQGLAVLKAVAPLAGIELELEESPIGGAAYDLTGSSFPDESLAKARDSDAILFGAVGGPKWDHIRGAARPEGGLLKLRKDLDLFANLRPALVFPELAEASTLKHEVVSGTDLMVVRELTGGIYFGQPRGEETRNGKLTGFNTMVYDEGEITRIGKVAFEMAGKRKGKLTSVDKANVLEVSQLWRSVMEAVSGDFPKVELSHMYVDNAAMQLIKDPKQFDTIVTGNMFGDILSDAAAMLTGSIGMLPSASIGEQFALYEPIHGSAPDIAGSDQANPLASILSVGMMFRYTFNHGEIDDLISRAVREVLETFRTGDLMAQGKTQVGCQEMGERVVAQIEGS